MLRSGASSRRTDSNERERLMSKNPLLHDEEIGVDSAPCGGRRARTALKRTLGPASLIGLGIGAIIGAGLFVRTAAAAAQNAGPSVTLGFIVAALGSAFAGLCYAEMASMIPIAGSAYTYTYATMGELPAWIIGWDLHPRVRHPAPPPSPSRGGASTSTSSSNTSASPCRTPGRTPRSSTSPTPAAPSSPTA